MTSNISGSLRETVGFRFVFGIQGTAPTPEMVAHFKATGARGLILYKRNIEDPEQVRRLISGLEDALGKRVLVCVDHEGGRVVMFRDGFTMFPDNLCFGTIDDEAAVRRQGEIEAAELRFAGVDVNLAPVLDVMADRYGPALNRSYGKDPDLVARLGAVRIRALQAGGVSATAKHFPGKGHATQDAHFKLPYIDSTLEEMRATHLKPFAAAVRSGVDCVMTSHPCYRAIDPGVPATFSRRIARGLLREELGFQGVVVTDDLEMGAVKEVAPIEEAVVKAAAAGHDLLLVCHTYEAERRAHAALLKAYESGALDAAEGEAGAARVESLLAKRRERFGPPPGTAAEGEALARRVARDSLTLLRQGRVPLPLPRDFRGRLALVFPRFSELASKPLAIEEPMLREEEYLKGLCTSKGIDPFVVLLGIEPKEGELAALGTAVQDRAVVAFSYDAHFYPGWRRALEIVQEKAAAAVLVPLRDPFDLDFASKETTVVTAFGFRRCQVEAVFERLLGC